MSAVPTTRRGPHRNGRGPHRTGLALGTGLAVVGALIAVGISILILALTGANNPTRTTSAPHPQRAVTYPPLVHYHGTGAPPAVRPIHSAAGDSSRSNSELGHSANRP
jgi:hypothetical protein